MTHKQIIEKYKATFNAEVQDTPEIKRALWDFIESAMNAAARGAAEAAMVEIRQQPSSGSIPDIIHSAIGWNDYMIQSSQQLTRYFEDKEV